MAPYLWVKFILHLCQYLSLFTVEFVENCTTLAVSQTQLGVFSPYMLPYEVKGLFPLFYIEDIKMQKKDILF